MILLYFVVKVTSGQEKIAANILQNKMAKSSLPIYSIMVVEGMRGYIILEAEDEISVRQFATKGKSVRGVLPTASAGGGGQEADRDEEPTWSR